MSEGISPITVPNQYSATQSAPAAPSNSLASIVEALDEKAIASISHWVFNRALYSSKFTPLEQSVLDGVGAIVINEVLPAALGKLNDLIFSI